jgi:hypothetical protein
MKRSLVLAISALALMSVSRPLVAAEAETPAARERAPARERAQPARAPAQRQVAQASQASSFTGNQVGGFGGGNVGGGGFADPAFCGSSFSPSTNLATSCPTTVQNISRSAGFIGGAEYESLFPIAPYWVAGWSIDAAGSTLRSHGTQTTTHSVFSSSSSSFVSITETLSTSQSQAFLSTLRLKIGVIPFWNTMIFVTGGAAAGTVSGDFSYTASTCCGASAFGSGGWSQFRGGYSAGGGVSFAGAMFGLGPSAKLTVEYLYANLGKVDQTIPLSTLGCSGSGCSSFAFVSMKTDTSTVRLKLSLGL